jgi:hypothetical protein
VLASRPNNQKFVEQLIEEGTKILQVPNPVDPLKASDRRDPYNKPDLCYFSFSLLKPGTID